MIADVTADLVHSLVSYWTSAFSRWKWLLDLIGIDRLELLSAPLSIWKYDKKAISP